MKTVNSQYSTWLLKKYSRLSFQCHLYQYHVVPPQLQQLFLKVFFFDEAVAFFENKTRKVKQVNISKRNILNFIFIYICFFSSVEKVVTKVNQIK